MAEPTAVAQPPAVSSLATDMPPTTAATTGSPASGATGNSFLKPGSASSGGRKRRRSPEFANATDANAGSRPNKSTSPTPVRSGTASPAAPRPLAAATDLAEQKRRKVDAVAVAAAASKIASPSGQQGPPPAPAPQTPNPAAEALGALMGVERISRPTDAPATTAAANTLSAPVAAAAGAMTTSATHIDRPLQDDSVQASPLSTSSFGTRGSAGSALQPTTNGLPALNAAASRNNDALPDTTSPTSRAFTYPGPLGGNSSMAADVAALRQNSLPGAGGSPDRDGSGSPSTPSASATGAVTGSGSSNKKHRCPYCATEFTRHHNLKSHLLTHSHEKPYLCQTCDARFRRLHDLKRHTKLHTGERPHVCPRCRRSFARGDALARHNKGQGGCAGRRSSVGSNLGGDASQGGHGGAGGDDSLVDGMLYADETSHEPEAMDEGDAPQPRDDRPGAPSGASGPLPSIHHPNPPAPGPYRSDTAQSGYGSHAQRQPSTYPPVASRAPMPGALYPPAPNAPSASASGPTNPDGSSGRGGSASSAPNPAASPYGSSYPPPPSAAYAPPTSMTESPKPLSPGQPHPAHRSPSLSAALHPPYGAPPPPPPRRQPPGRASPPSLPPPPTQQPGASGPPHLPSLPGLAGPDPRYPGGPLPPPGYPGVGPPPGAAGSAGSASNSLSSHGAASGGGGGSASGGPGPAPLPYDATERVWAVVRGLEAKVERLEDEVRGLRGQLREAQAQLVGQGGPGSPARAP